MSTPESNPFELSDESSEVAAAPARLSRPTTGPQPGDFGALMLQLCLMGVIFSLVGVLLTLAYWPVGAPLLSAGLLLIGTGRGLGAYRIWAWYAAVAILAPLNLALAVLCVWASYAAGAVGLATLLGPAYCGYVLWTLLSPAGRKRYWHNAAAATRIAADRGRTVRKPYRKR